MSWDIFAGSSDDGGIEPINTVMKLYEVLNSAYYLGSHVELHRGRITRHDLQMPVHPQYHATERLLEQARPPHCLSRSACVFLADSEHAVKLLGMPIDHIYTVQPIGNIERSDLNWWKLIADVFTRPQKEYPEGVEDWAQQYWSGAESPTSSPIWEYRVASANIG